MSSLSKKKKLKNSYYVGSTMKASSIKFNGKQLKGHKRRLFYTTGNRLAIKQDLNKELKAYEDKDGD